MTNPKRDYRDVHEHKCGCGDYLVCTQGDKCAVIEPYQCPTCAQIELDDYISSLEHHQLNRTHTQQEKPRYERF